MQSKYNFIILLFLCYIFISSNLIKKELFVFYIIACVGQTLTQALQFLHFSFKILAIPSSNTIASKRHLIIHAPQPVHRFVSITGKFNLLFTLLKGNFHVFISEMFCFTMLKFNKIHTYKPDLILNIY